MAKTTSLARPSVILMSPPRRRGGFARRAGTRIVRVARRAAPSARRAVPTVSIALGGAVVGYVYSKGFLDKLPQIGGSKMMTLGLAGWAATRFVKNQNVRMAGLAALAAAAFDFGRVQGGGTSGLEDSSDGY